MAANKKQSEEKIELTYAGKVWQTVGIVALLVVTILVIRVAFDILLMVLAGALISVYFHGLGDMIQRRTKLNRKPAMIISILSTVILLVALFWFMGTKIQEQVAELSNTLPHTIKNAQVKLSQTSAGQKVLQGISGFNSQKMLNTVQGFFSTTFGVLGDMYIILFLGIFFTTNPSLYKDGILVLVPHNKKELGKHIMDRISLSLKGWLKGTLFSMLFVTILIGTALTIVGVPVALILALITGLLEMVPSIGSLIAMIPGVLLALTISTNMAILVAVIYIVSQTIVANIVTPMIQKKMINLPPALTLISQLIMGTVSGALGIILAVPLLAILIILVDELYVKKIAHNDDEDLDKGVLK
ncbi:AI-2E family transporter [Mucilaginibacter sp. UR6-11]|uniref:AI-2E family transporter n=1 Tax=Mucilaginibacter sp. UR6-11 TaxID=1435644 RepID=UPI001E315243|nr:AI-2E family transporter [Mucilaginibacter sp. UR6-11]MCC8425446.1 AI-2E family transporter [Mucilaginibacter sp. UR6-11]